MDVVLSYRKCSASDTFITHMQDKQVISSRHIIVTHACTATIPSDNLLLILACVLHK